MMNQTKIYQALKGVRGRKAVDLNVIEHIIVGFSQLVVEQPQIKEIDINPLLVSANQIIALDARVILHPKELSKNELPKPVIRPYPHQYIYKRKLKDNTEIKIRPICPEDEPRIVQFHKSLSEQTVYQRYFQKVDLDLRIEHSRLSQICFIDYNRQIALVALIKDSDTKEKTIIGIARIHKEMGTQNADFSLIVSDPWQNAGLGSQFMKLLVDIAKEEKIRKLSGIILKESLHMRHICEKLGFKINDLEDTNTSIAEINL